MLDSIGALASIISTYYFIRLSPHAWLISLVAIGLNGYLYWQKGIYGDMSLELFYFLTTCYGWLLWRKPTAHANKQITQLTPLKWALLIASIAALFVITKTLLLHFTQSNIATLDALTTALSLAAQCLMCHKSIATWALWFLTDVIYAYLYWHKQLPMHALLMFIYTGMAVVGYCNWRRILNAQLLSFPQSTSIRIAQID